MRQKSNRERVAIAVEDVSSSHGAESTRGNENKTEHTRGSDLAVSSSQGY